MRWEQHLRFNIIQLNQSVVVKHAPLRFEFECSRSSNELVIRYQAQGAEIVRSKQKWWFNSHFIFEFDFEHDHRHRYRLVVLPDGAIAERSYELAIPAEEEAAVLTREETPPEHSFVSKPGELAVSLSNLRTPVIGFNSAAVLGDTPVFCAALLPHAAPFDFADLYIEDIPQVRGIQFNYPEWKLNRMDIDGDARAAPVKTRFAGPDFALEHEAPSLQNVPYELDRRAKWSNQIENDALLFIQAGAWRASFPVSFDHGLIPRDRLGGGKDLTKPSPCDPDFMRKLEAYYLGKLPALRRVIDHGYWLASEKYKIDLLSDSAADQINTMLVDIFPEPVDYLCGLAVLAGSPAGPLHSASFGPSTDVIRPGDVWAFGRGFCGTNSGLFAHTAAKAAPKFGLDWKCYYAGLEGHVVVALQWNNAFHIFDPMVGKFFFSLDNTRLATLNELQEIRDVSYRVDCFNRAKENEFYFGRTIQLQEFNFHDEQIIQRH